MDVKKMQEEILRLRLQNAQETYALCNELLAYVHDYPDAYLEAFAHAYLGDYYISMNDTKNAFKQLFKARDEAYEIQTRHHLLGSIYSFLGIAYEMDGDEQNAISNYLDGLSIAKEHKDKYVESINLNNLGVIFQRHAHWKKALEYFLEANKQQSTLSRFSSRSNILCNIGDVYLHLGKEARALKYYNDCEYTQHDVGLKSFYHHRNQCCYFASLKQGDKAIYWAEKVLEEDEFLCNHQFFGAFDHFNELCQAMFKIENQAYIKSFLTLMEQVCYGNVNELQIIEDYKLKYTLMFCAEEEHVEAYYRYYSKTQEFKDKINHDIAKSMKDKIYLNELIIEKKALEFAQKDLEKEVNLDEITGIYNRRYVEIKIKQYAQMNKQKLAIVMFDVDYFKEFNDAYGHGRGDYALRVVGDSLKAVQKEHIFSCRYGGDEFICFLDNMNAHEVEDFICKVREKLHETCVEHAYSPCSDRVTLSIGYAIEDLHKISIYDLLILADEALYECKLSGRNSFKKKGL